MTQRKVKSIVYLFERDSEAFFICTFLHLYVLSSRTVYIMLSILFSLHLEMMKWSHRSVG